MRGVKMSQHLWCECNRSRLTSVPGRETHPITRQTIGTLDLSSSGSVSASKFLIVLY